jgi:antitoxin component of MazEF toxin-antitoxin module
MAKDAIVIPVSAFSELELQDGDQIEGQAKNQTIELRVVRRQKDKMGDVQTAEDFVRKWTGRVPDIAQGEDPRLSALVQKHLR